MRKIIVLLGFLFMLPPCFAEDDVDYENAYLELSPDIVSNLKGQAKYIRATVQIMTNRADMLYEIEMHEPMLRHTILMILADKQGEQIKSQAGKEALRGELLQAIANALDEKIATKGLITNVFFTSYHVK